MRAVLAAAVAVAEADRVKCDDETIQGDVSLFRSRRPECGQAYIELVMVLPLFLIVIGALILFGRVLYVKIALDMASYDACRAAVEALRPGDGMSQGLTAGQETLKGFYLNSVGANVAVSPQGGWTRGAPVQCVASYDLFVGDIPGVASLHSTTWSRVELWRSDWQ